MEQLIAATEDFEITPNQEKLNELLSKVTSLEQEYERARKELIAKQIILDKFQKAYQDYVESGIEEKKIENDKKLIEAALGTADKTSVPTRNMMIAMILNLMQKRLTISYGELQWASPG